MLTSQQRDLLIFIHGRHQEGVSPSYDEMAKAIGLKSKSGINRLISGLVERGFITTQRKGAARAVEIVKMPDGWDAPKIRTFEVAIKGRDTFEMKAHFIENDTLGKRTFLCLSDDNGLGSFDYIFSASNADIDYIREKQ